MYFTCGKGDIIPSIENPYDYFLNNVRLNIKLLSKLNLKNLKKFVYSLSSCYGLAKTPTREDHPINPLYPYALLNTVSNCNVLSQMIK